MMRSNWFPGIILVFALASASCAQASPATGGFWQHDSDSTSYPPLTASQIASFLPNTRSAFTFPAPYNTQGFRITLPSDCPNSSNCVEYIGYSYWARMNNSSGSADMYILVGLGVQGPPGGPTLYEFNKDKDTVTKLGAVFPATSSEAYSSAQSMYFSYGHPYGLYYIDQLKSLMRINILTKATTTVFNIGDYNGGDDIDQCSSSNDDNVHACTLETSSYTPLGCIVYEGASSTFKFFPTAVSGGFDECHIGAGGRYLLIDEKTPQTCSTCDEDTVLVDLKSGAQTTILNQNGGGGHYATGYGYYAQAMNWDNTYSESMVWDAANTASGGSPVFAVPYSNICSASTCAGVPQHPSWLNALPPAQVPVSHQYACDSTANTMTSAPFANQVYCFYLDGTTPTDQLQSLVVAPTLTNFSDTGCGPNIYEQEPKGNIDFTGHYFIWSANLDSNTNCQVFIVRIPTGQLSFPPADVTPPEVSISSPAANANVNGVVSLEATVWSNDGVSSVQWQVDGQTVGSSSSSPYTYKLDTSGYALGNHTLAAIATDTSGNTAKATETLNFVETTSSSPSSSGSGGLASATLLALGLLLLLNST